jgi:hypothetical protein
LFDRGDIFLGNLPAQGRGFLKSFLEKSRSDFSRLIIPAVGKFAGAEVAVSAGWRPEDIYTSDVSLFSSVVGYFLAGKDLRDLEIDGAEGETPAEILYSIKLSVLENNRKSYYDTIMLRDMKKRKEEHLNSLNFGLTNIQGTIGGINYEAADLYAHMNQENLAKADNLIYVNPPGYAKGYEKMYDTGGAITWKEPEYNLFEPVEGHAALQFMAKDSKALVLRYKGKDITGESPDGPIFANEHRKGRTEYMIANYPEWAEKYVDRTAFPAPLLKIEPSQYPILPEGYEIKEDSTVACKIVPANQALYYRDLFAHRLGATRSELHYVMLVDGYICGVFGIHRQDFNRGNRKKDGKLYIEETYGFSPPNRKYHRLNRLLMMIITTQEFQYGHFTTNVYRPDGLATTCLARYPELKTNRGILKLVSRKKMPNGIFHLRYLADARDESYGDTLKRWLQNIPPPKKLLA